MEEWTTNINKNYLSRRADWEAHEPNVAFFVVEAMDNGNRVFIFVFALFLGDIWAQKSRFPTNDRVFARFRKDKVTEPVDTVDVVGVNFTRVEYGKILDRRGERAASVFFSLTTVLSGSSRGRCRLKRVRIGNCLLNGVGVEAPYFKRMVHSARDDPLPIRIKILNKTNKNGN